MMFNDTLKSLLMTYYNVIINLIGSQNFTIIGSSASYLSVLILSSLVHACKCVLSLDNLNSLMSKPERRLRTSSPI